MDVLEDRDGIGETYRAESREEGIDASVGGIGQESVAFDDADGTAPAASFTRGIQRQGRDVDDRLPAAWRERV